MWCGHHGALAGGGVTGTPRQFCAQLNRIPSTWATNETAHIGVGQREISDILTTEANTQVRMGVAGAWSRLRQTTAANTLTRDLTTTLRLGGVSQSLTVTVAASSTADVEDLTDSVTVAVNDLLGWRLSAASGGSGTNTPRWITSWFTPTGTYAGQFSGNIDGNLGTGLTRYFAVFGYSVASATEAEKQSMINVAGTISAIFVNVSANSRLDATTVALRVNGVDGPSVSIAAGATGIQGLSGTAAIAAGDLVGLKVVTGAGAGSFSPEVVGFVFTPTSGYGLPCGAHGDAIAVTTTTNFSGIMSSLNPAATTEADRQLAHGYSGVLSKLSVLVSVNSTAVGMTAKVRVNGADGNGAVATTAGATGWFTDASNTDTYGPTDLVNYQYSRGAGGGTLSIREISTVNAWTGA
jgi:hypothetical protein